MWSMLLISIILFNLVASSVVMAATATPATPETPDVPAATGDEPAPAAPTSSTGDDETLVDHGSLSTIGGNKNILGIIGSDQTLRGRVSEALKYNEQVHYIMTYTILKGAYMESGGYSELYKSGAPASGFDQDISGLTVQMGYNAILETGATASNPHLEDELAVEVEQENQQNIDYEGTVDALADEIAKYMSELYVRKFYNFPSKMEDWQPGVGGGEVQGVQVPVYLGPNADYTKKFPSSSDVHSVVSGLKAHSTRGSIYTAIKDNIKTKLNNGSFNDAFSTAIYNYTVADTYTKAGPKLESQECLVGTLSSLQTYVCYKQPKSETRVSFDKLKEYLTIYPVMTYNSERYSQLHNNFQQIHTDSVNVYKTTVQGTTAYKDWIALETQVENAQDQGAQEIVANNIGGLAWTPLDIRRITADTTYTKLIRHFDGGVSRGSNIYVSRNGIEEGRRAVQVNDFVAIKRQGEGSRKPSASPYFTYDYDTHKNTGVAKASVGNSDAYFLGNNLGLYAGMKSVNLGVWDKVFSGLKSIFNQGDYGLAEPLTAAEITANSNQIYPHKYISYLNTSEGNIQGITGQADYTVGIDNYGNIISGSTLQVIVPYWHNTEIQFYNSFNTADKYFVSTPAFQSGLDADLAAVLKAGSATGTPRENENIAVSTFQIKPELYTTFLKNVKTYKGDSIPNLASQVQGNVTNVQALALSIVSQTKSEVATHNKAFLTNVFNDGEIYMSASDGGRDNSGTSGDLLEKFNAADLLERIKMILDYGFYEIIRLTIVSWVVSFYTGTVSNFSMSAVFHTSVITDTEVWDELLPAIARLLGAFVGVYIIFLAFRVVRNTLPLKSFLMQFVTLSSVIVIPLVFYGPLINFALNKPTQAIVGTQMEQISILDNYLYTDEQSREMDEMYALLFGSTEDLRDRSQDYLVTFYTTTHTDGFLITEVTEGDLNTRNRLRSVEAMESGKWRPQDLVKARVSIFDLFEWVESDTSEAMFTWLATQYPDKYADLATYTEYSSTPAANIGVSDVKFKASDVYKITYDHSESAMASIEGLFMISQAFRNKNSQLDTMKITDSDREALIRDLSLTSAIRQQIYGDGSQMSPAATALWTRYGGGQPVPSNDFFNLDGIVNTLIPQRDFFANRLEADLYNINREIIDNYIVNYSIVRENIGSSNNYTNAEFHIIVMDMWFKVNGLLDIHNFPTTYSVDTISFDNYMRLVFIPMNEYADLNNKGLENVGQFVSLRTHPGTLLFAFLPALILLMIFGLVYIVTFYVLMMILIAVSFIWNYVIKNNMQNKSWLGALIIITSFAIAKVGLLLIWRIMSYFMNLSTASSSSVTYPYVLLHSIIICVYLSLALYLLFTKVFKAVLQDKSNLGGELFSQGISNLVSGLQSTFGGGKGGRGKNGLRDGLGSNNGAGSSVKKALKGEGREGKITADKNPFTRGRLEQLTQDTKRTNIDEDLADLNYAIHNEENVGNGHEFAIRFADTTNELNRELAYQLGEKYDGIETGKVGLSQAQIDYLEANDGIGQVVTTNREGTDITTINALTEDNAQIISKELNDLGVRAVTEGTQVAFNSAGLNLVDAGVRKRLLGGILPQLLEETHQVSALSEYESDTHNYSILEDGRVVMGVGADGVAPETLDTFLRNPVMTNSFAVEETPVMKDGKYLQGNLILVPKTSNQQETIESVNELFEEVDPNLRKKANVKERADNVRQVVEFTKNEKDLVYNNLAEGLQIQNKDGNDVVVYDESDEAQVAAASNLKSMLYRQRDAQQEAKSDLMQRTVAYINEGEDNGFATVLHNTADSEAMESYAYSQGIAQRHSVTKVYGGDQAEKIVQAAAQVQNITKANPEMLTVYANNRDVLYRYGEQVLAGTNNDQEQVLTSLFNFAKTQKISSDRVEEFTSLHNTNKQARMDANLSEKDYTREVEGIVGQMQLLLQDNGAYDVFMADVIRDASKKSKSTDKKAEHNKVLDNYVDSKVALKGKGIDVSTFDHYSSSEFDRLANYINNITKVVANEDNTVTIEALQDFDAEKIRDFTRLLAQVREKENKNQ